MSYLGNTPTTQNFISGTDYFNGTGSQTAFTLSRTVNSVNDIQVVVNNVVQQPNDAYTLSGTTLTMTSAPSAGTNNVYVRYLSTTTQVITPSQNTVSWNTLDSNIQQDLGVMYKNRIINGNMVIDQRNAGASVTPPAAANTYVLDRFAIYPTQASKLSFQQNAGSVTPPAGFTNYLGATSLSAYSVTSGDLFTLSQQIEGFNIADLAWGTANAKTVTLSFWVRSSLTGTFSGVLQNSAQDRAYAFTYSIPTANTWTSIAITVAGDTTGTWLTNNGRGIGVNFSLGCGSTFSVAANSWTSTPAFAATGSVNLVGTNGATWYLTGVQLEVGTQATAFSTAGGSYGAELALCQRYYYKTFNQATAPANAVDYQTGIGVPIATAYVTGAIRNITVFPQTMRTTPTVTFFSSTLGTPTLGSWSYYNGFAWTSTTSTGVSESSQLYVSAEITRAASFTQGFSYLVNGFLTASAEL